MEQKKLNEVRIDEWYYEDKYEEKFRIKLTAKHALAVGKWTNNNEWGIDLREWSYDLTRLLGKGITLNSSHWQKLYEIIVDFHNEGYFTNYGSIEKSKYIKRLIIDDSFLLKTDVFQGANKIFLCINIVNYAGRPIWKGRHTFLGIMLLFNVIPEFLSQCQSHNLVDTKKKIKEIKKQIDGKTGKEIF